MRITEPLVGTGLQEHDIERLDLAPYGRFADRALNLSRGAALHVVLGANESGKTTTLSAIGDLLFGFPGQTDYAFQHDQRLLRVGGAFTLADGSRLDIRRRKGNKDTLLDAENKPISEAPLLRALGAIERKAFETEFGLSQRALRRTSWRPAMPKRIPKQREREVVSDRARYDSRQPHAKPACGERACSADWRSRTRAIGDADGTSIRP